MSISTKNTAASPGTVMAVNKAGSVPPVSADLVATPTATVTTTGANAITYTSTNTLVYGIAFSAGSGAVNSILNFTPGGGVTYLKNCKLTKAGTSGSGTAISLGINNNSNRIVLDNTTVQFGSTSDSITVSGRVVWKNTSSAVAGATFPTTLFKSATGTGHLTQIHGVDLSAITGTLIEAFNRPDLWILSNCKLGAAVTITGTNGNPASTVVHLIHCDSGDTNYRTEKHDSYMGIQTTETTIVRSGGATDGTTPIAWKVVNTANSEWISPFESLPITIWNETTGSAITVSLYGYWNNAAVPTTREIWMEAEYLGTSGFPVSSFVSSGAADYLAAAANITEDTNSSWGGGDTTTRFKMSVTFTPQEKGPITLRVYVAKASATMYVDPKPEISGVTVSKSLILAPGVYANEIGAAAAIGYATMSGGLQ